jgi:drug/metabolite transporter superfamily protein YnfA
MELSVQSQGAFVAPLPPAPRPWTAATVAASLALFAAAAVAEVGGGWLVWQGVVPPRRRHPAAWIVAGCALLVSYGFIPTLQARLRPAGVDGSDGGAPFSRVYAVYGGVFIVASYVAGWALDGVRPDIGDWVGAGIALVGVGAAWFWPRGRRG